MGVPARRSRLDVVRQETWPRRYPPVYVLQVPSAGGRTVIDKKTASFVQSLCMGQIEEQIVVPYPEMKAAERETLAQVIASVNQLLAPRAKDFREWDVRGEMPASFIEEL